ncbi:MAG: hypothetical protein K9J48_00760 [Desulfohalobiaceae bacterium]|nr:hypothetical protein [Desulfohalobiaceae bacterium]
MPFIRAFSSIIAEENGVTHFLSGGRQGKLEVLSEGRGKVETAVLAGFGQDSG